MLQPIGCATLGEDPQSSLSDQCPFGSGGDGGGGGEKKQGAEYSVAATLESKLRLKLTSMAHY